MLRDICLIQAMFSLCEGKQCDNSKLWWVLYFLDTFFQTKVCLSSLCLFKRTDMLSVSIYFVCVCCSLSLFLKFILVLFSRLCGLSARNCKKFRDLSEGRKLLASGTFSGSHSVNITP